MLLRLVLGAASFTGNSNDEQAAASTGQEVEHDSNGNWSIASKLKMLAGAYRKRLQNTSGRLLFQKLEDLS